MSKVDSCDDLAQKQSMNSCVSEEQRLTEKIVKLLKNHIPKRRFRRDFCTFSCCIMNSIIEGSRNLGEFQCVKGKCGHWKLLVS